MSDTPLSHTLSARRPSSGPDPLLAFLKGAIGKPVTLDFSKLDRLDARRLQVLLAGQRQWGSDDKPFHVNGISDNLRDAFQRMGIDRNLFHEGAQK